MIVQLFSAHLSYNTVSNGLDLQIVFNFHLNSDFGINQTKTMSGSALARATEYYQILGDFIQSPSMTTLILPELNHNSCDGEKKGHWFSKDSNQRQISKLLMTCLKISCLTLIVRCQNIKVLKC